MVRTRVRWPILALLSLALSIGFLAGRASGGPRAGSDEAAPQTYVVRPGDTLWEIARGHVGPDADPRVFVADVVSTNGLPGAALVPGTELVLPAG